MIISEIRWITVDSKTISKIIAKNVQHSHWNKQQLGRSFKKRMKKTQKQKCSSNNKHHIQLSTMRWYMRNNYHVNDAIWDGSEWEIAHTKKNSEHRTPARSHSEWLHAWVNVGYTKFYVKFTKRRKHNFTLFFLKMWERAASVVHAKRIVLVLAWNGMAWWFARGVDFIACVAKCALCGEQRETKRKKLSDSCMHRHFSMVHHTEK